MSWYKRREPTKESEPVHVKIPDLQLTEEHKCDMIVTYDDNSKYTLSGRVNQNPITKAWTIHGIDFMGHQCMVDVNEIQKCIYCELEYGYHDRDCPQRDLTHFS